MTTKVSYLTKAVSTLFWLFECTVPRATENELLEDYLKAVDFLTIDDKYAVAKQFSGLEDRKNIDITQLNQDLHEKSEK
jgi:hypothetical protein